MPGLLRAKPPAGLLLLACFAAAFSAAAAEPPKKDPVVDPSADWTVAVAAFDTSRLETANRLSGDLIVSRLAEGVFSVSKRRYPDAERGAYIRYLTNKAADAALKELAAKQASRDALLFAGLEAWKYEVELRKAEEAILTAREAYDAAIRSCPIVAPEKKVKSAKENASGAVPPAPKAGEERAYCEQRACDALLLGKAESLYGRVFVSIRLYSPYLNGDLYADSVAFSTLDRETVLAELSRRLAAAISGVSSAAIAVKAAPDDADIHLDGVFAGKGSVEPIQHGPGAVRVTAERPGFERFDETIDVLPGESAKIEIALPAYQTKRLAVTVFGPSGEEKESRVRLSGLYIGSSPIGLSVFEQKYLFVEADLPDGKAGMSASAVVNVKEDGKLELRLSEILPKGSSPVEDARRSFYGAFGRFMLCMPVAFFLSGVAFSYQNSAIWYTSTDLADLYDKYNLASIAAWTVAGGFAVESIVRFVNYLRKSDERAVKLFPTSGS